MSDWTFDRAKVALCDPAYMNRQASLGALQHLGFSNVETFSRPEDLVAKLGEETFDLIIAELRESEREVFRLVTKIRAGTLGENPFVAILLTTWDVNEDAVKIVLNSGADDLLGRPFSMGQLQQRVQAIAGHRKPFVVTCDYMGPSRRKTRRHPDDDGLFEAPNTFRSLVMPKAKKIGQEHVHNGWNYALQWRIFRLGERIKGLGQAIAQAGLSEDPARLREQALPELDRRSRALDAMTARLNFRGSDKISAYSTALLRIVDRLSKPDQDWQSDGTTEKVRVLTDVCNHVHDAVAGLRPRGKIEDGSSQKPRAPIAQQAEANIAASAN